MGTQTLARKTARFGEYESFDACGLAELVRQLEEAAPWVRRRPEVG